MHFMQADQCTIGINYVTSDETTDTSEPDMDHVTLTKTGWMDSRKKLKEKIA